MRKKARGWGEAFQIVLECHSAPPPDTLCICYDTQVTLFFMSVTTLSLFCRDPFVPLTLPPLTLLIIGSLSWLPMAVAQFALDTGRVDTVPPM